MTVVTSTHADYAYGTCQKMFSGECCTHISPRIKVMLYISSCQLGNNFCIAAYTSLAYAVAGYPELLFANSLMPQKPNSNREVSQVYLRCTFFDSSTVKQSPQVHGCSVPAFFRLCFVLGGMSFLQFCQVTARHSPHNHSSRSARVLGSCSQCKLFGLLQVLHFFRMMCLKYSEFVEDVL